MKTILAVTAFVLALGSMLPSRALADGPVNLALFNPIQIITEDQAVTAFRFSLIYGVNTDLTGGDLSLVGINRGSVTGVQLAGLGLVEGSFTGWQAGLGSITRGALTGFQSGPYNEAGAGSSGFQLGLVNTADGFSGFQLGIVNITQTMHSGLQVGICNIINNKEKLTVLPIVNWKF